MKTPHTAIYARTSRDDIYDITKISIDQQIESAKEEAKKRGLTVAPEHIYIDRDLSGKLPPTCWLEGKGKSRPALSKMIEAIERKEIDSIIIRSRDRIARNTIISLKFYEYLKNHNVEIYGTHEHIECPRDAAGRFALTVIIANYQFVLETIQSTTKAAKDYAKKNHRNLCGARSLGYKNINKTIVIDETEAELVREIYKRFLAGENMPALTNWMNENYKDKAFGKKWYYTSIAKILRFEGYINEAIQPYPPIIDKRDWLDVQNKLALRKNTKTGFKLKKHLATNFFTCAHCGKKLQLRYRVSIPRKDGSKKIDPYYFCECGKIPHMLEQYYLEFLENLVASAKLVKQKVSNGEVVELEIQKDKVKKNLDDLLTEFATGKKDLKEYNQLKEALAKQMDKLDKHIASIKASETNTSDIKNWLDMSFDEKREHIDRVVEFIKVSELGTFLKYKPVVAVDADTILDHREEDILYYFPITHQMNSRNQTVGTLLPKKFKAKFMHWKWEQVKKVWAYVPSYDID